MTVKPVERQDFIKGKYSHFFNYIEKYRNTLNCLEVPKITNKILSLFETSSVVFIQQRSSLDFFL